MNRTSSLISITVCVTLIAFALLAGFSQEIKADMSGQSSPSVSVVAGGSITVTPTGMSYGSRAAGTHIAYTEGGGHYVQVEVNTNTTSWYVQCSRDQNLTSGAYSIASTNFIYTSVYNSGTPADALVYGPLEFGTSGTPSDVTRTPTTPAAAAALKVDVNYDLTIPPTQAAASNYHATHTYTLTAS